MKVEPVKPSSVKLNARRKTLKVGQKFRMTATVSPSNAGNKKVTWISSKKTVATVSSDGDCDSEKSRNNQYYGEDSKWEESDM